MNIHKSTGCWYVNIWAFQIYHLKYVNEIKTCLYNEIKAEVQVVNERRSDIPGATTSTCVELGIIHCIYEPTESSVMEEAGKPLYDTPPRLWRLRMHLQK